MSGRAERIAGWLRARVGAAGARGLVVGLSGGVDSAVVARLCQVAAPEATLAVLLPCHGDSRDERDARLVAGHFKLTTMTVNLERAYDALIEEARHAAEGLAARAAKPPDDLRARVPLANIKPRLRMTMLYFVANRLNYLVAGTGNLSELAIGYFTKYGDGGVDLLPIGALLKNEVRALAHELHVPHQIIDRAPTAGLWLGQTDEAEMGFTYADLEAYLRDGPAAVDVAVASRIERLVRASEHKRALPPVFEDAG